MAKLYLSFYLKLILHKACLKLEITWYILICSACKACRFAENTPITTQEKRMT
jgi:hypothetical protein